MRRQEHLAATVDPPRGRAPPAVRGQRLDLEDVQGRDADAALLQRVEQVLLDDERPPGRVDKDGPGLEQRQVRRGEDAARAVREHEVHADNVGRAEQLLLADDLERLVAVGPVDGEAELARLLVGGLLGEVGAPGDDLGAEGQVHDARHGAAQAAQPQHAEGLARHRDSGVGLPAAGLDGSVVRGEVAGGTEDAGHGVLRGAVHTRVAGLGLVSGAGNWDAPGLEGGQIQCSVAQARGEQELEVGEPAYKLRWECSALAHRTWREFSGQSRKAREGRREILQMILKGSSRLASLSFTSCGVFGWLYGRSVSLKMITSCVAGSNALKMGADMFW